MRFHNAYVLAQKGDIEVFMRFENLEMKDELLQTL